MAHQALDADHGFFVNTIASANGLRFPLFRQKFAILPLQDVVPGRNIGISRVFQTGLILWG